MYNRIELHFSQRAVYNMITPMKQFCELAAEFLQLVNRGGADQLI